MTVYVAGLFGSGIWGQEFKNTSEYERWLKEQRWVEEIDAVYTEEMMKKREEIDRAAIKMAREINKRLGLKPKPKEYIGD